jgi:hypothetical protein
MVRRLQAELYHWKNLMTFSIIETLTLITTAWTYMEQEREYILKNPKMAYQINNVRSILMEQLEAEWRVEEKLVLERKQK